MAGSSSVSPDVARARFATWVQRTLDAARDRGMTDRQIAKVTGVGTSTFHRWRKGEGKELPELDRVRAFATGLGARIDDAMKALGVSDRAPSSTPEPPLPAEVRTILRALADPNVPESSKLVIREMLLMLAEKAATTRRTRTNRSDEEPREAAS